MPISFPHVESDVLLIVFEGVGLELMLRDVYTTDRLLFDDLSLFFTSNNNNASLFVVALYLICRFSVDKDARGGALPCAAAVIVVEKLFVTFPVEPFDHVHWVTVLGGSE